MLLGSLHAGGSVNPGGRAVRDSVAAMSSSGSRELAAALEAAGRAERIIMRDYGGEVASRLKPDNSPVTQADVEAEQAIVETLRRHFPDHGFLGEEGGASGDPGRPVWVIDPIDGTKNFVRGIPLFGTQIALTVGGAPVLGVSCMPAMGETLYAEAGRGAFLGARRLAVSGIDSLAAAQVSFGGLNHFLKRGRTDGLLSLAGAAGRSRAFGDVYAYHLLATGRCEVVVEAHISFWDIAALTVIVTEAGGRCTDLAGRPIGPGTSDIVCSNGKLHAAALEAFRGPA
jgi:histidinol-phosphatase